MLTDLDPYTFAPTHMRFGRGLMLAPHASKNLGAIWGKEKEEVGLYYVSIWKRDCPTE